MGPKLTHLFPHSYVSRFKRKGKIMVAKGGGFMGTRGSVPNWLPVLLKGNISKVTRVLVIDWLL